MELKTRCTTERRQVGGSLPTAVRAVSLPVGCGEPMRVNLENDACFFYAPIASPVEKRSSMKAHELI
jgi:hypothetical protein